MNAGSYELIWSRTARRAVGETLPEPVAVAAVELITGLLAREPRRVGRALGAELTGVFSARVGSWRVLYQIDERSRTVTILDIQHRSTVYRSR